MMAARGPIGVQIMRNFGKRTLLKVVTLAAAGTVLSGCVYDAGLGYASDGYYDDYSCDPYGGYDSYYDCDYGSGFFNIGFGGGWYDSYWYPGHGYYLFDNYGRRHMMRQHHRRYWGERRHSWYRENRGSHRGNGRYEGRDNSNTTPGAIGWPERNGGRVRDGDDDRRGRGEVRRNRNNQWRGGDGNGANAVPMPNPDVVQGRGRGDGYRGRRGDGQGRRGGRGNNNLNAVPVPQPDRPDMGRGGRGEGGGRFRAPPPPVVGDQSVAPRVAPAPRADRPRPPSAQRPNRDGGERILEQ